MAQLVFSNTEHLAHAYIAAAASEEERLRTAKRIAMAAVCSGIGSRPCLECRNCRKAAAGIHPDITFIGRETDDKGKTKTAMTVDQIRGISADAVVLPNEAERKVYIITEAEYMNIAAQNAALKLLEEPPAGVVFVLCTPSAEALLPTVRSRCVIIKQNSEEEEPEESTKLAKAFLKVVASGERAQIVRFCAANESMKNGDAREFFACLSSLSADMLCGRKSDLGIDSHRLTELCRLCSRCSEYLQVNTGVKHIFGLLAVDTPAAGRNRG